MADLRTRSGGRDPGVQPKAGGTLVGNLEEWKVDSFANTSLSNKSCNSLFLVRSPDDVQTMEILNAY